MKGKGNSLQAMLNRATAPAPEPEPAPVAEPKVIAARTKAPRTRDANRVGTKLIGGHFPPEVSTQLRILAAEGNTTMQALLDEAIQDLLTKKGRGRIGRA